MSSIFENPAGLKVRIISAVYAGACPDPGPHCKPFVLMATETYGGSISCPWCHKVAIGDWHIPRIALELDQAGRRAWGSDSDIPPPKTNGAGG